MINFCVSLTTLPTRIDNINETIISIKNQTQKPDKIFLNLPHTFRRFPKIKFTDIQIQNLYKFDIEITRCNDYGPGTKLLGSLDKIINEYDCVILLDDDHIYHKEVIEIFIENFKKERINYSYFINKVFNIKYGQGADGILFNTKLLSDVYKFYEKNVHKNKNLFLDDDFWYSLYIYFEKKSRIVSLSKEFSIKTGENIIYSKNFNNNINALNQNEHKSGFFFNRRKIQKIEYMKYKFRRLFNF